MTWASSFCSGSCPGPWFNPDLFFRDFLCKELPRATSVWNLGTNSSTVGRSRLSTHQFPLINLFVHSWTPEILRANSFPSGDVYAKSEVGNEWRVMFVLPQGQLLGWTDRVNTHHITQEPAQAFCLLRQWPLLFWHIFWFFHLRNQLLHPVNQNHSFARPHPDRTTLLKPHLVWF